MITVHIKQEDTKTILGLQGYANFLALQNNIGIMDFKSDYDFEQAYLTTVIKTATNQLIKIKERSPKNHCNLSDLAVALLVLNVNDIPKYNGVIETFELNSNNIFSELMYSDITVK